MIRFDGLSALRDRGAAAHRAARTDGTASPRASPRRRRPSPYPPSPRLAEVLETYLLLGVHHILLGADHLLFVLALLLIVRGWRRLALTITAFTVGHTLTLAAATLGARQPARTAGRGGHRAQHRLRRRRGAARPARRTEPDGRGTLGGGASLRAPARPRLRGRAPGDRAAGERGPARRCCSSTSASNSGSCCSSRWSLGSRLGAASAGRSQPAFGPSGAAAAADAPGGLLRHRRHGGLLADRACPGVLVLNAGDVTRRTRIVWAILRSAPSDSAKAMGDEPGAALTR